CSSDDRTITYPDTPGLAYAESESEFTETYRGLRASLQNSDYRIEKEIDFKEYAESLGKRSREAKMILFSNPSLEVPLLKDNPEMVMEFQDHILTLEDLDEFVLLVYNKTEYYSRMYGLISMAAVKNSESSLYQILSSQAGNMTIKNETAMVGENTITIPSTIF